ncbi:MAG: hypothetical protein M1814_003592 [Vezdaea aestivalis]|nr:MAG: hypothetical protein M1814_003592 [Vezdaea aestivalis]
MPPGPRAFIPSRHRASSANPATIALTAQLSPLIDSIRPGSSGNQGTGSPSPVSSEALHRLRQSVNDADDTIRAKDVFRQLQGFEALLDHVLEASLLFGKDPSEQRAHDLLEMTTPALSLLSETLLGHSGNRRYFSKRAKNGGWVALRLALSKVHVVNGPYKFSQNDWATLFGNLLCLCLADDSLSSVFKELNRFANESNSASLDDWERKINDVLRGSRRIVNPEVLSILLHLTHLSVENAQSLAISILLSIFTILATASKHNLTAIHGSELVRTIFDRAFTDTIGSPISEQCWKLSELLLALGVPTLKEGQQLFRASLVSPRATNLLLRSLKVSREPSVIEFDLFQHGYGSVELRTVERSFPLTTSSQGYTLAAWIRVDKYDDDSHTTLFGAFDETQKCFVLVYIEKKTQNLILQTSINSARPSVRFKSTTFRPGIWYHLVLVHRRPRTTSSSKASLFVNGIFKEQIKSVFPSSPPAVPSISNDPFSSLRSNAQVTKPVQVFLGTPRDLAARLGRGVITTRWSLASAHLFGDILSDDLIFVYYQLGPRYSGNYQDTLGSFQTYEASAQLHMRNENLHPGKEEKSEIVAATRLQAGRLMPESRIFFSIAADSILDDNDRNTIDESQLVKSLSKTSAKNLQQWTRIGGHVIAINGAVPSINEALIQPNGAFVLAGDPTIVIPRPLDLAFWQMGGCVPLALKAIELATTRDDVLIAVEILFECIRYDWRNSEAMERDNGFAILAALLQGKMGHGTVISSNPSKSSAAIGGGPDEWDKLSFSLLSLVLDFVGYRHAEPEESVIVNQLAYRALLVDFDLWKKTALITQKLYFKQFEVFGSTGKHAEFNSKRLQRMRIVKRLVDALKGESISEEAFPYFISAFKSLVIRNATAEVLRSISLFITYTLHRPLKHTASSLRSKKSSTTLRRGRQLSSPSRPERSISIERVPSNASELRNDCISFAELGTRVLEMYADVICKDDTKVLVQKFARTVTNRWLLYLLAEDDPRIILLSLKIIARVLVVHGKSYVDKFATKTGGFIIMEQRLKRWWNVSTIWPICFAILFNVDIGLTDFNRPFDLFGLMDMFTSKGDAQVIYPEIFPIITALLKTGLQSIVLDNKASKADDSAQDSGVELAPPKRPKHTRKRSMSLGSELSTLAAQAPSRNAREDADVLQTVSRFLADIHERSKAFRDFAATPKFAQELLFVLYPVVVASDTVSAGTELESRDSALTFDGSDVMIKSLSMSASESAPIIRTTNAETPPSPRSTRSKPTRIRRGSSFILVTSNKSQPGPSTAHLNSSQVSADINFPPISISNSVVEGLLELIIAVFIDQVLERKDFSGFGLYLKVPPGFQEHQVYFNTYILRNTLIHLGNTIQLRQSILHEPKTLINLSRLTAKLDEALSEGWFLNGAEPTLDFIGTMLEYLQRPDVASKRSIRLCSTAIQNIRSTFMKVVLLRLSELDSIFLSMEDTVRFLNKILYWQTVILSPENDETAFLKLMCYLMYIKLVDRREEVRLAAANLWRMTLVQKPDETAELLDTGEGKNHRLSRGFRKLMELDNETFVYWVDDNREQLDKLFFGAMSKSWEDYVRNENQRTNDMNKSRVSKRKDRLKVWAAEEISDEETFRRHEVSAGHWSSNISASEHIKYQRMMQDHHDDHNFLAAKYSKMVRQLHRPCGILADNKPSKWQLDQTEGRNRMRLCLLPDESSRDHEYQSKLKRAETVRIDSLNVNTRLGSITSMDGAAATPIKGQNGPNDEEQSLLGGTLVHEPEENEEFEFVDGPNSAEGGFEDKNRKVIRTLQRGDQIQHVYNISRIIGLEFCEGLLIIGKDSLYLLDSFFQRSDGEIINVWQASPEERDAYLQMISGRETQDKRPRAGTVAAESRHWKWSNVLSFSKRRFLFRGVAIEIFFTDGSSYLLTATSPAQRDELYSKLASKAPHATGSGTPVNPEDAWRIESLRAHDDEPQTLGSKFANVFGSSYSNPATRKWAQGEISNFHYLMLVNTMAGRTFNDLTQYPVFPWVLADYTSDELDLTDPRSFRDLSKPMGCQNPEREEEFRERYQSFAEMDSSAPSFHYGTHYSSAMIVTSYLIRLQPFVQSYLVLQGGSFDHPDRLFYSIHKAWMSASRENMTDVRELTPEFYFLPDFLTNSNNFNFGVRQGTGEAIDTVTLPPWAKGDPKIFIARHREALESPYVSEHLHKWIDLIFGFKQKGDAALEATNLFHHLSYQGAKDLDLISDPVERLATIGIIHNFGQTPHQVFTRGHPSREQNSHRHKRLDTAAESLTELPFALLETQERVSSLIFSAKQDRLLCSAAFRLNIPPNHSNYMEWGFIDCGVRFYTADGRKQIGLSEHLHCGQLSCAVFANSRTLITGGTDCTVSVWNLSYENKAIDLQPRSTLFGHTSTITTLALSQSFNILLSASSDGIVYLWDLNRLEFIRELARGDPVECARINDITGNILLCRGQTASLYTLNGESILIQNLCDAQDDYIACCAFYEGVGDEWLERELVLTGHKRGVANIWAKEIKNGTFVLSPLKRLNHIDRTSEYGANVQAAITYILPMPQTVYTGDENGTVQEWNCVQRQGNK